MERNFFKLSFPHFNQDRLDRTLIPTADSVQMLRTYVEAARPVLLILVDNNMQEMCWLARRNLPLDTPEIGILQNNTRNKQDPPTDSPTENEHGLIVFDSEDEIPKAQEFLKKGKWIISPSGSKIEDDHDLTFLMNRVAIVNDLHQQLSDAAEIEVLAMYVERIGFWEGTLHVEQISEEPVQTKIQFHFNQWLENKLLEGDGFIANWMWIKDRWKIHKSASDHLNLQRAEKVIEKAKKLYGWESLPRTHRVWIRMPDQLGNIVKWIPFVKAVRDSRQDAEVTLVTNRRYTPLLEAVQVADKVLQVPRRNTRYYEKFINLRGQFPDSIYQFNYSLFSDFETRIINAPRRFGIRFPGTARTLLTDTFEVDPGWDERKNHQTELWKEYLQSFGLCVEIDFEPLSLAPGHEVINPLRCLQTDSRHAPYIGLICGAGNLPEKCWPADYWVEFIAGLMDLYPNSNLCLFGTSADLDVSREIIEEFEPGSIHDFTGSTDILQFVMALQSCAVVISNDCGGLHLANAMGVPAVGLYGPTNPVNTHPIFTSPIRIVQPAGCPKYGGYSPRDICLPQVFEAVADLVPSTGIRCE